MRHYFYCVGVLLLSFTASNSTLSAQQPTTLIQGKTVEATIKPGQSRVFQLPLEQDQYALTVVDQHGIDLIVGVTAPDGKMLATIDSPNGAEGPENVEVVGAIPGIYTLTVSPLADQQTKGGNFDIHIVEVRHATEDELRVAKNQELVKGKGKELLVELLEPISQLRLLQTKVRSQLQAADLLWDLDEKLAKKISSEALSNILEYLGKLDLRDEAIHQNYADVMALRNVVIESVAPHDPEAALSFLKASRAMNPYGPQQQQYEEMQLELTLSMQIAAKDPKKAFEIAEESLKTGPSSDLFQIVIRLRSGSPELATKLASDMIAKIQDSKLLENPPLAQLAANLIRFTPPAISSPTTESTNASSDANFMSQDEYKNLVQKVVSEALSYNASSLRTESPSRNSAQSLLYTLKSMSEQIERTMPGSTAAIEKKLSQYNQSLDPNAYAWQKYQNAITSGTTESAMESIAQAPAEYKEQLYSQLSQREAATGNTSGARQLINEHITNPVQRQQLLLNLEQQTILNAASKGRIDEALRRIANLKSDRMRCELLTRVASQIGPGQKRTAALNLLETARSLIGTSPQPENQDQLFALIEIAKAFARYDTTRAFEIFDPLVDQLNGISEAARTLNGFGQYFYRNNELDMTNGNSISTIAYQMTAALATLSAYDFDRAKQSANRIQLPEIRIAAELSIARTALTDQRSQRGMFTGLRGPEF